MSKLEALLKIIEDGKKRGMEELKALVENEKKERLKKIEKWLDEEKEKLKTLLEREKDRTQRRISSMKESILTREKALLKSEIVGILKEEIKKELLDGDRELRKKYLQLLFEEARKEMSSEYVLYCRRKDLEIIKEFYDGEIHVSRSVDGGIVLQSKDGRMRVVADIDYLMDRMEGLISDVADRKAGELA